MLGNFWHAEMTCKTHFREPPVLVCACRTMTTSYCSKSSTCTSTSMVRASAGFEHGIWPFFRLSRAMDNRILLFGLHKQALSLFTLSSIIYFLKRPSKVSDSSFLSVFCRVKQKAHIYGCLGPGASFLSWHERMICTLGLASHGHSKPFLLEVTEKAVSFCTNKKKKWVSMSYS